MKKNISPKIISLTFGILIIIFAVSFYVVAWQEPGSAPPSGNVAVPLNTGAAAQYKSGALGVGGVLQASGGLQIPTGAAAGKVLISDASGIATWQTSAGGGSGVDTTYRMAVSSYCLGGGKYCAAQTASFSCPAGSVVSGVICDPRLISGISAGDTYACVCPTAGGSTAALRAKATKYTSCTTWSAREAIDECSSYTSYSGSCTYSCGSNSCTATFRCGAENQVGTYSPPQSCTFSGAKRDGAACNSTADMQYCQQACTGAGWGYGTLVSCSPNLAYDRCNFYGWGVGCGVTYDNCWCWWGGCSPNGHQVSCRCWN